MTPNELLQAVTAALQTDMGLAAYCVTAYDRAHIVYDSLSGEFPPAPTECPYILVHSPAKIADRSERAVSLSISVDYFVYDTEDETRVDDAEVSSGSERLLTIMELGKNAVVAALDESVRRYDQTTNTVDLWPLMVGAQVFDISETVYIGMDPLA